MNQPRLSRHALMLASLALFLALATASTGEKKTPDYRLDPKAFTLPDGATFGGVSGVAVDSKDRIFVLQRSKPHVLVLDKAGKQIASWTHDSFKVPHGLRVAPDDSLWIADMSSHLVQNFSPEGKLLLSMGKKDTPGDGPDRFNRPADVAVGPDGDIYVADGYGNSRVAVFDKTGKFLREWGKKGKGPSEFNIVHAVVIDPKNRVIVGDRENARVQIFDLQGKLLDTWSDTGHPYGIVLHHGRVFLADGRAALVRILDLDGKQLARWDVGQGTKDNPHWVSVDGPGNLYVGFVYGKKLEKWTPR